LQKLREGDEVEMKDNDLITRREVELVLLEKGQRSRRYSLGEVWELDFDEIREALSEYQPKIVRCKDCKYCEYPESEKKWCKKGHLHGNAETWFCADGERKEGM